MMVWENISMEEHTDLYRLGDSTLTPIGYQDGIFGVILRPYSGAGWILVSSC